MAPQMRKKPDYKRALEKLMKILDDVEERKGQKGKIVKENREIEDITENSLCTAYQFSDLDFTVYQNSPVGK